MTANIDKALHSFVGLALSTPLQSAALRMDEIEKKGEAFCKEKPMLLEGLDKALYAAWRELGGTRSELLATVSVLLPYLVDEVGKLAAKLKTT